MTILGEISHPYAAGFEDVDKIPPDAAEGSDEREIHQLPADPCGVGSYVRKQIDETPDAHSVGSNDKKETGCRLS